ncbi:flavin-containing monooxygenase [Paraliomyxa miuraensis]|uniref:flavin-containing monooxygenase n=1 Tax=Paraliomyxa miuraensis TaxID=376150 RepID=UPI0022504FDC|nr:NAD(P)/FAD-dependent oxidoreductase [Paraliomyxa miuraensis]MCX4242152.1 NAD(P)/FAD-dependent oxidoreductase [Paraliomyxa miuraensis]
MTEHFDVVIVGAGISGISAACHLQERCPDRTFVIFEGRPRLGGTWDLFRYPGIRSDSDMYTLGFRFEPWKEQEAIADGDAILKYLHHTVNKHGLQPRMRFEHRVVHASWSSAEARWTLEVTHGDERVRVTCGFLFMCSGYYDYEQGHAPRFPGAERFAGTLVHPQHWPQDLDYAGKRIVVIGSGATAVTLVPELSKQAAHVTMLQRSPTYILSRPRNDAVANLLRRVLPRGLAYDVTRWKNVLVSLGFYELSRRAPRRVAKVLIEGVRRALPAGYDVQTHFTPHYDPWDQRLCLVPDGDLFEAIESRRASVVTDHIECFTEHGILLRSGQELPADIIVTATGLKLLVLGRVEVEVDGEPVDFAKTMAYKAMMFSDVPNLALCFGYTNASWTLKADLTSEYVCRMLNHMQRNGYHTCVPRRRDASVSEEPFLDFSSGYVQRALPELPKQGSKAPWKLRQKYLLDVLALRRGKVDDGVMEFL